jgi:hypothetical protein
VPITDLSKHAMALKTHLLDLAKYYVHNSFQFYSKDKNKDKDEEREKSKGKGKGIEREYVDTVTSDRSPSITMINLIDKNGSQGKLGIFYWNFTVTIIYAVLLYFLFFALFIDIN